MSKPGDIQKKTKNLIGIVKSILNSLDGEKITIRFILYKLIGMKDDEGKHATFITSTKDYDKLVSHINNARIRQNRWLEEYKELVEYRVQNGLEPMPDDVYGLPDDPFVDNKREVRHRSGYVDAKTFIDVVKSIYTRDIWQDQECSLFLLVEKATVADVIESVAGEYQVPLCVSMGYFGRSFMIEIANRLLAAIDNGKKVCIGYIGDHDPSGLDMEDSLRFGNGEDGSRCAVGLRDLMQRGGSGSDFSYCDWERLAITTPEFEEMSSAFKVPIKELEKDENGKITAGDSRSPKYQKRYGDEGAEVEALDPEELRDRVRKWINDHLDHDKYDACQEEEKREQEQLAGMQF